MAHKHSAKIIIFRSGSSVAFEGARNQPVKSFEGRGVRFDADMPLNPAIKVHTGVLEGSSGEAA